MDFIFHGLDDPIRLPDDYLTLRQFERFTAHVRAQGVETEDPHYMRELIGVVLEDPELCVRTDSLPLDAHNAQEWNRLAEHFGMLISGGKKIDPLAPKRKRSRKPNASC